MSTPRYLGRPTLHHSGNCITPNGMAPASPETSETAASSRNRRFIDSSSSSRRENGIKDEVSGITQEELHRSIADQLTEEFSVSKKPQSSVDQTQAPIAREKFEVAVSSNSSKGGLFGLLSNAYALFKVHMKHTAMVMVTAAVVLLACSLRGDLLLFAILTYKSYQGLWAADRGTDQPLTSSMYENSGDENVSSRLGTRQGQILPDYLQLPASYNLTDFVFYVFVAVISSELMYHIICGFLQVFYYKMQREEPEKWKCQPHRFLTRSNELHEVVVGTSNLVISGGISGFVSCWIMNGNYSSVYFDVEGIGGYLYLAASIVLLFLWLEAAAYYSHALLHTPWFYKNIHKHHHRYHAPTAYSVVAMSPFELLFYQSLYILPLFTFPIHGLVFVAELVYVYYFALMDHSGIKMESWLPWQPNSMFHDDHHRYFHCNFGFNAYIFDWLHGTMRQKGRLYGESVFGGKGKGL